MAKGAFGQAQFLRRQGLVAIGLTERLGDEAAFYLAEKTLQIKRSFRQCEQIAVYPGSAVAHGIGQALQLNFIRFFQLAHVAGPAVRFQAVHGFRRYAVDVFASAFGVLAKKEKGEKPYVFSPVAQGGEVNVDDGNPVEKVLSK